MTTRLDHDIAVATATAVLGMVEHLLQPDQRREIFCQVLTAVKAGLARRDELLARERSRLLLPSDN